MVIAKNPYKHAFNTAALLITIALVAQLLFVYKLASANELPTRSFLDQINAQTGKITNRTSGTVTVAVIDSGIYFGHPALRDSAWQGPTGENGWNFLADSTDTSPLGDHGTEVAGIIKTVAPQPEIKLMSLVVCGKQAGCTTPGINQAIRFAADNGASVINLSLGIVGANGLTEYFNEALTYAYQKGVVIVAAAGNGEGNNGSGQDLDLNPISPICNDNGQDMVLGVSSVDEADNILPWANYGSCIDVAAPGSNIYTTGDPAYKNLEYTYVSGTSFSTGVVSALAAQIKLKNPGLKNRQIMDLIKTNTVYKNDYGNKLGTGRIDAQKTLLSVPLPAIAKAAKPIVPASRKVSKPQATIKTAQPSGLKPRLQNIIRPRGF